MIKRLTVGQMQSNCYLVWDEDKNALVIDPGDDGDFITQNIIQEELTPRAMVATHGHFDHMMAALELKLAYNIPFYMHKADEFLLARMRETAKHFVNFDPGPAAEVDVYLKDNAKLKINNLEFKIIHTPGHTPGGICLYFRKEKALFVGDVMFLDGSVGETSHAYSDVLALNKSIEKVKKLGEGIAIYPGHGDPIASLQSDISERKRKSQPEKLRSD